MLLPVIWGAFGIGEALSLQYLLTPITGSLLPFLFLSTAMVLIVMGVSLYSIGFWEPNFKTKKAKVDLTVLSILIISGLLIFYTPFALFPLVLAGFYLLAVNIE